MDYFNYISFVISNDHILVETITYVKKGKEEYDHIHKSGIFMFASSHSLPLSFQLQFTSRAATNVESDQRGRISRSPCPAIDFVSNEQLSHRKSGHVESCSI